MALPAYLREKAQELRGKKRLTIDELAERLALPRTTIYYWVRDMPIPGSGSGGGWPESARRRGNRAMRAKYRELREAAYDEGLKFYPHLMQDPSFRDFIVLFITEGQKRNRNEVSIANSDPALIMLAVRWMAALSASHLSYSVQCHADQDRRKTQSFWADLLKARPDEIRLQRKSNSMRLASSTWRCEHGVLTVRTCDTYFREELQAWVDCLRDTWLDSASVGA